MKTKVKNLVVDQGNSSVKLALFNQDNELVHLVRSYENTLSKLEDLLEEYEFEAAIYAATGQVDNDIVQRLKSIHMFLELKNKKAFLDFIDYESPESLGFDRLSNAVAARSIYPNEHVLVIDIGTCITYDVINANGMFQGGAISPGPKLRNRSMNDYTANLPLVELEFAPSFIGKNTNESLQSGIMHGIVYEIDGYIDALAKKHEKLTTIITGGYTILFANAVKNAIFADSNFTLKGYNAILNHHDAG